MDGKISLKIPFTINEKELIALQDPNIRLSGFGVFWGGILLLSFILAFFIRYRNKEEKDLFCLIFSILIILLLANPYCWWARYTPHQWCLPIFICVAALIAKNNRLEKSFSVLILILMLANVFIQIPRIFIYENRYHSFIDNQMQMLKQLDEKIKIYSVYEYSFIEKLKLNNIKFEFVNEEYYRQNEKDFTGIPFSLTEDMRWNIKEKN